MRLPSTLFSMHFWDAVILYDVARLDGVLETRTTPREGNG